MKIIDTKEELIKVLDKYLVYATDYDGTIIDSMKMWGKFASDYVKSKGLSLIDDIDEKIKYRSNYDASRIIYNDYHMLNSADEVLEDINRFVVDVYPTIPLKNGAKEFLDLLDEKGKNLLSSATPKYLLMLSANARGILDKYKDIYSSSDLMKSKEDGSLFKYILSRENIKPNNLLVIEDSILAMKACSEISVDTLIIKDDTNSNNMEDIFKYATYYIDLETINWYNS